MISPLDGPVNRTTSTMLKIDQDLNISSKDRKKQDDYLMSCDMIYIHSLNILCDENTIVFRRTEPFAN